MVDRLPHGDDNPQVFVIFYPQIMNRVITVLILCLSLFPRRAFLELEFNKSRRILCAIWRQRVCSVCSLRVGRTDRVFSFPSPKVKYLFDAPVGCYDDDWCSNYFVRFGLWRWAWARVSLCVRARTKRKSPIWKRSINLSAFFVEMLVRLPCSIVIIIVEQ